MCFGERVEHGGVELRVGFLESDWVILNEVPLGDDGGVGCGPEEDFSIRVGRDLGEELAVVLPDAVLEKELELENDGALSADATLHVVCWSSMVYRIVDVVCNDLHFAAEFGVPEQKAGNSAEGRQLSRRLAQLSRRLVQLRANSLVVFGQRTLGFGVRRSNELDAGVQNLAGKLAKKREHRVGDDDVVVVWFFRRAHNVDHVEEVRDVFGGGGGSDSGRSSDHLAHDLKNGANHGVFLRGAFLRGAFFLGVLCGMDLCGDLLFEFFEASNEPTALTFDPADSSEGLITAHHDLLVA